MFRKLKFLHFYLNKLALLGLYVRAHVVEWKDKKWEGRAIIEYFFVQIFVYLVCVYKNAIILAVVNQQINWHMLY